MVCVGEVIDLAFAFALEFYMNETFFNRETLPKGEVNCEKSCNKLECKCGFPSDKQRQDW